MKKFLLLNIVLAFMTGVCLHAQDFKTNVSIKNQLKNNSVPGLQYASGQARQSSPKPHMTMAEELKRGRTADVNFAPGTGHTVEKPNAKATAATTQTVDLTSSKPMVVQEAAVTKTTAPALPNQGDVTQEQADAQAKKLGNTAATATAVPPTTQALPATSQEKPKEVKQQ